MANIKTLDAGVPLAGANDATPKPSDDTPAPKPSGARPARMWSGPASATDSVSTGTAPTRIAGPAQVPDTFRDYIRGVLIAKGADYRFDKDVWAGFDEAKRQIVNEVRKQLLSGAGGEPMRELKALLERLKNLPPDPRVRSPFEPTKPGEVQIFGQNFENLFLPVDDPKKDDDEYTPGGSNGRYTDDDYRRHRQAFELLFKSVNGGKGPDVIGGVELEGMPVAEQLAGENLAGMGYAPYVGGKTGGGKISDGEDQRGIRNGAFSRYPLWPGTEPELLTTPEIDGERGILVMQLNMEGQRFVVAVNHWKSMRDGEDLATAQNSVFAKLLKDKLEQITGGPVNDLVDATSMIVKRRAQGPEHPLLPEGSHDHHGHGDFLDRIIVNGAAGLVPESVVCIPKVRRGLSKDNDYQDSGTSDHSSMAAIVKPDAKRGIGIIILGDFNTKYYEGEDKPIREVLGAKRV